MGFNPIYSFINYSYYKVLGKVRLDNTVGEVNFFKDKKFEVFRHIQIAKKESDSPAVFWVRFTLPHTISFAKNRRTSLRALPFFCGLPGFREKYWCVNTVSNEFLGLYEWSNYQLAEAYSKSFALRFMKSRAKEGSISFDIYRNKKLAEINNGLQQR